MEREEAGPAWTALGCAADGQRLGEPTEARRGREPAEECHLGPKGPGVSPFLLAGGWGCLTGTRPWPSQRRSARSWVQGTQLNKCQFFREGRAKPHTRGNPMCIDIQNLCVLANIVEPRKISAGNKKPCDFQSWAFPDVYGVTHL